MISNNNIFPATARSAGFGANGVLPESTSVAAKSVFFSFCGIIFSKPMALLLSLLISRLFGAKYLGFYAICLLVVKLADIVASLGLNQGGMRAVAIAYGKNHFDQLYSLVIFCLGCSFVFSLVVGAIIYFFAPFIATDWFSSGEFMPHLRIVTLCIPFSVVFYTATSLTKGFHTTKHAVLLENILFPSINIISLITLFFTGCGFWSVIIALVLSKFVSSVVSVLLLLKVLSRYPAKERKAKVELSSLKKVLVYSIPFIGMGIVGYIMGATDLVILGKFVSMDEIGVYSAATRVALIMVIFLNSSNSIFSPLIASAYDKKDFGEIWKLYHLTTRWLFFMATVIVVFLISGRNIIMSVFGSEFINAGPAIFCILLFGQFISVITGGVGILLTMTGHQFKDMNNRILAASMNLFLNFVFIMKFGVIGAAWATTISIAIVNLLRVYQVYKLFGFHPFRYRYLSGLLLSALFICISLLTISFINTLTEFFVCLFFGICITVHGFYYTLIVEDRNLCIDFIGRLTGRNSFKKNGGPV